RKRDAITAFQILTQSGVDERVVIIGAEGVPGARRLAFELNWQQDRGCFEHDLRVARLLVVQHSKCQKKCVDSEFLQANLCLLVYASERLVERLSRCRRL